MRHLGTTNKKGITPIIAIILLLLMTVAAAGAAFFFLSRIQGQMQGGVESFQGQIFETISSQVEVISASYNSSTGAEADAGDYLTVFVQNVGNNRVPVDNSSSTPTTTWIFKDAGQNIICSSDFSGTGTNLNCSLGCEEASGDNKIEIGEIRKIVTYIGSTACNDITDSTLYGSESIVYFQLDFSGIVAAAGSFIK